MKKSVKKYLIAGKHNDHKPHILRGRSILVIAGIVLMLFLGAVIQHAVVTGTDFAAVISSVLVDLTNGNRTSSDLHTLRINSVLVQAAQMKANDMASKSYFAHTSPDGITPWYWFREAGYDFLYAGENLAVNFSDSIDVEHAWMNSPKHRENILSDNFSEIGIATAKGIYKGRETTFVVQLFGRPLPEQVAELRTEERTAVAVVLQNEEEVVVLGEEASLKYAYDSETFVAVDADGIPLADIIPTAEAAEQAPAGGYASALDTVFAAPRRALYAIYGILAMFIILALSSFITVEIKRRHTRHIAYGAGALVFIGLVFYISHVVIYAKVFVQ